MTANDKSNKNDHSNPDSACTRCRERKIKCGRERPCCSNCERDDEASCVYQTPAKRVNHLKLLCDNVDKVEGRLESVESGFARLNLAISQILAQSNGSTKTEPMIPSPPDTATHTHSDDAQPDHPSTDESIGHHIFRDTGEMIDYFHGSSSLFVLCNHLKSRMMEQDETDPQILQVLAKVCRTAGEIETLPIAYEEATVRLPMKQQAVSAVEHFLRHVDFATDIFVPENLLGNLERIYLEPLKPQDEAWATCLHAIIILVLGRETALPASNALLTGFARNLLPSRAALVNPRLLTSPRLINIQALLLLSVAAQQYDPPGWAEMIFFHACTLARTIGLQYTKLSSFQQGAVDDMERSKVLRALYARDRSYCTLRGRISWLPTGDCDIGARLRQAVQSRADYPDRCRLSLLQDEIVHLPNVTLRDGAARCMKLQNHINRIERALASFERDYTPLAHIDVQDVGTVLLPLEFLATRILAFQKGSAPRHTEQILFDARRSCVLLLLAEGNTDSRLLAYHKSLSGPNSIQPTEQQASSRKPQGFGSGVFDVFSVPGFFVLLNQILNDPTDASSAACIIPDSELLRSVSMAFTAYGERLQSNNYHRKTGHVFSQVLSLLAMTNQATTCRSLQCDEGSSGIMEQGANLMPTQSNANTAPGLTFDASMPALPGTSLTWDQWLSEPSMTLQSPSTNLHSFAGDQYPDFTTNFDFMPGPADSANEATNNLQLNGIVPSPAADGRKRRRTGDESQFSLEMGNSASGEGVRSPEIPFHLIS